MRKIIFIAVLFVSYFGFSQGGPKMNVAKFVGELTTTERNSLDVPTGERWLIWNATTEQFEHAGSDDVWSALTSVSSANEVSISDAGGYYTATDVEAALQEIASDVAAISDTDDQTASEVNITDSGGNYTGTTVEAALAEVADSISVKINELSNDDSPQLSANLDAQGNQILNTGSVGPETDIASVIGSSSKRYAEIHGRTNYSSILLVEPTTGLGAAIEGHITWESSSHRLRAYDGTSYKKFIFDGDAIDISDLIDDDTFATASSSTVPSSESVKAYVDAEISGSGAVPSDAGASDGDVLTTDGAGTYTWETPSGGGSSPPFDANSAILQDETDNTKLLDWDLSGLTTGTTRTVTMPDFDVNLGALTTANIATASLTGSDIQNGTITLGNMQTGSVNSAKIFDGSILEVDIAASNSPTDDYILTYNAGGANFTWVDPSTIGGVQGTISGRTGTDVTSVMLQTQAQFDSDGATSTGEVVFISDASPAEVVTSATIAMEGWKMYNDSSTDAATITLSDCDPGETLTVYINRASAPTLAGTGLTFNQLPNTTAFASSTDMMIIFEVSYDSTTIDYYYVER